MTIINIPRDAMARKKMQTRYLNISEDKNRKRNTGIRCKATSAGRTDSQTSGGDTEVIQTSDRSEFILYIMFFYLQFNAESSSEREAHKRAEVRERVSCQVLYQSEQADSWHPQKRRIQTSREM